MTIIEHKYNDRGEMIDALYRAFLEDLRQLPATLLLSGGSTPGPLYQKLSQADLDWDKISVALVDERWVDTDHSASNERFLREHLLVNNAARANFVGMKNSHRSAFGGQAGSNARYAALPKPFRLCLLGMGPDGHTASLFPRAEGLEDAMESQQCCAAIRTARSEVTGEFIERMTMTPWSILQSEKLILLITGDVKWQVYQQASQNGATPTQPISLFIHQDRVPLEVYWSA